MAYDQWQRELLAAHHLRRTLTRAFARACSWNYVRKACILLMYPDGNASSEYLDDVVSPPAPSDTFVAWSTIYLVDKKEAL